MTVLALLTLSFFLIAGTAGRCIKIIGNIELKPCELYFLKESDKSVNNASANFYETFCLFLNLVDSF